MRFAAAARQSATPRDLRSGQQGYEGAHVRLRCPAFEPSPEHASMRPRCGLAPLHGPSGEGCSGRNLSLRLGGRYQCNDATAAGKLRREAPPIVALTVDARKNIGRQPVCTSDASDE